MKFKSTHIVFISLAAAVVSCTTDSYEEPSDGRGAEMSFAVSGVSRSSVTEDFDKFAVYGDMRLPEDNNIPPTVIFNKTEIERKEGVWGYRSPQYWFLNYEHSFVGVYPLTVLEEKNTPQYSGSKLTFTYTLPTAGEKPVYDGEGADIVAATHRRLYSRNGDTTVTFNFHHLLSLINFTLKLEDGSVEQGEFFKVHKLEITGFDTTAAIGVTPAQLQSGSLTNDSEISIDSDKEGKGRLEIEFKEPIKVIQGAAAPVGMFGANKAIIMIPQQFPANSGAEIGLTYSINDEEATTYVSHPLSGFEWKTGKSYKYDITLALGDVTMSIKAAEISAWTLVDGHDEIEVK